MADPRTGRTGNLVRSFCLEEGFEVGSTRVRVIGRTRRKVRLLIQAPVTEEVRFITEDAEHARAGDRRHG